MSVNSSTSSSEHPGGAAQHASCRRYLLYLGGSCLSLLACAMAFNWFINPYGIYDPPEIDGINRIKYGFNHHLRLAKAYAVSKVRPRSVILGSSRAESAFDPAHPGFRHRPVYSLAISGAGLYELMRYLQHAQAARPLDEVIFAADFFMFNAGWEPQAGFDESRLAVTADGVPTRRFNHDLPATLLSIDALGDSWWSLRRQRDATPSYNASGLRDGSYDVPDILRHGGHRRAFIANEDYFARYSYRPDGKPYRFVDTHTGRNTFDWFRKLVAECRRNNSRLTVLIPPVHARQLEVIRAMGLWPRFEAWKRELAEIMAAEGGAAHVGQAYVLWDFSGVSSISSETVPAAGDSRTAMHYYRESSHFTQAAGDLALDRIFGHRSPGRTLPDDFGVRITLASLESHLLQVRADLDAWRVVHAEDVGEIADIVARHRKP